MLRECLDKWFSLFFSHTWRPRFYLFKIHSIHKVQAELISLKKKKKVLNSAEGLSSIPCLSHRAVCLVQSGSVCAPQAEAAPGAQDASPHHTLSAQFQQEPSLHGSSIHPSCHPWASLDSQPFTLTGYFNTQELLGIRIAQAMSVSLGDSLSLLAVPKLFTKAGAQTLRLRPPDC